MLPAAASNDFVALSAGDDAWSTDWGEPLSCEAFNPALILSVQRF